MREMANDDTDLRARLEAYLTEAQARRVLVLDNGGYVLGTAGGEGENTADVSFGALMAGAFQSAREMAAIMGETELRALHHHGAQIDMHTQVIADHWLLITVFDGQARVGLVQRLAAQMAPTLAPLLLAQSNSVEPASQAMLQSAAFRADFDDTFDRLFRDVTHTTSEGS